MTSFQAKTGWKRPRKREYKNYRSVSFQPNAKQKIKKKQQKNSKIQKIPLWHHFQPKKVAKMMRKRENKNYRFVSFLHKAKLKIP